MTISHKNKDIYFKYLEFLVSEYNFQYMYKEDSFKSLRTFKKGDFILHLESVHTQQDTYRAIYVLNNGWKKEINFLEVLDFYRIKFSKFILIISKRYYFKLLAKLILVQINESNEFFSIKLNNDTT